MSTRVKMPRIRRKFALILSVAVIAIILIFYVLINLSITPEKLVNIL